MRPVCFQNFFNAIKVNIGQIKSPLSIRAFQDQCKQTIKDPKWREADQLDIYKHSIACVAVRRKGSSLARLSRFPPLRTPAAQASIAEKLNSALSRTTSASSQNLI